MNVYIDESLIIN